MTDTALRVVSLLGSPRRDGNSTALARAFCDAAAGAAVTEYALPALEFSGCQVLHACKTGGETCGLKDDASAILEDIAQSDIVVMATPIYFTDVSSHMKKILDRFYSFLTPDYATADRKSRLAPGKHLVFIQVQGEPAPAYADTLERYDRGFRILGFAETHHIYAAGMRAPGDVARDPDLLAKAAALGKDLSGRLAHKDA